jgi:hypothetical protein
VITRVLPEPAPASTKQGPCKKFTASCCARFKPGPGEDILDTILVIDLILGNFYLFDIMMQNK